MSGKWIRQCRRAGIKRPNWNVCGNVIERGEREVTDPLAPAPKRFDAHADTVIIGAGAAGLTAALAHGPGVVLVEAEAVPAGSTALSAGLIPAAGTVFQRAAGIKDTPAQFAADIQSKARHQNDPALVKAMTIGSAAAIDWLADLGLPFSLVTDFDYPGHSHRRMHGLPSRSGRELIDRLRLLVDSQMSDILYRRRATQLFLSDNRIAGLRLSGPNGQTETLGCNTLILACNGFGGDRNMVAQHMPDIKEALWFGHDGNKGDAVLWGAALGARLRHLGAYQGHGNVAHPHGILITWAVIMAGGIQVNLDGHRFWDETQGYSEAARTVLSQPGGKVWTIFDTRIARIARQFEDFRQAEKRDAIRQADSIEHLAQITAISHMALRETLAQIAAGPDPFGRQFSTPPLNPPYCAVQVTGALFHTQGGLVVNPDTAQVLHRSGHVIDNLYATGGAACGVSGNDDAGYLSGNGLLAAITLGRAAGLHAAQQRDMA